MPCFLKIVPWAFYRRYIFYSQCIDDPVPITSCQLPFRLELVKEKDLQHLMALRHGFYDLRLLKKRLSEGHLCFLGWSEKKPIHIRWVFVRSLYLPYLHRTLILSPKEVYGDEVFTVPGYRHQRVNSYAGYLMRLMLQALGYHYYTCVFASWDAILKKAADRIGLKKVGEVRYWSIPGNERYCLEGMVQDYGNGKISVRKINPF